MESQKISLCLTTYNRSDLVIRAISNVIDHPVITEIVIVDDCSTDENYQKLRQLLIQLNSCKVRLYRNSINLDCYQNKKRSVELATNEWVIIFDSDNIIDNSYIDNLLQYEWDKHCIYAPDFARPQFDYRNFSDSLINIGNLKDFVDRKMFDTIINTCNYFVNRSEYLKVHRSELDPHAADTCYFNYCWIMYGNSIFVVQDLQYEHMVHDGSHYKEHNHKSNHFFSELMARFRELSTQTIKKSRVSFKPMGRAGNFFFEAAAAYAYALKHNLEFSIPSTTNDHKWNPLYLQHLINKDYISGKEDVVIEETEFFKHNEIPFKEEWRYDKQIVLSGYFQNPKYFELYRKEILEAFNIPVFANEECVSIHIRRGDYLIYTDKHPAFSDEYMQDAMAHFRKMGLKKFIVFSDDMPWCKNYFSANKFNWADVVYSEGKSEMEDIAGIAGCDHHINSSSTFSWWGAWLNENDNKVVITPKEWLLHKHANQWTPEIIPSEWIKM